MCVYAHWLAHCFMSMLTYQLWGKIWVWAREEYIYERKHNEQNILTFTKWIHGCEGSLFLRFRNLLYLRAPGYNPKMAGPGLFRGLNLSATRPLRHLAFWCIREWTVAYRNNTFFLSSLSISRRLVATVGNHPSRLPIAVSFNRMKGNKIISSLGTAWPCLYASLGWLLVKWFPSDCMMKGSKINHCLREYHYW